jgi:hypothetical protein
MSVGVDEARGHDRTGSIELPFALGSQPRADLHNSAISNSDVAPKCCLAGPIDDAPATNEKISHGPTPCASQCLFIRRLRPHSENATSDQIAGRPASPSVDVHFALRRHGASTESPLIPLLKLRGRTEYVVYQGEERAERSHGMYPVHGRHAVENNQIRTGGGGAPPIFARAHGQEGLIEDLATTVFRLPARLTIDTVTQSYY